MSLNVGFQFYLQFFINQTDLLAGTVQELVAPCDGYIEQLQIGVQVAVTTGGTITVKDGASGAAGVLVNGLTATIANAAAKGTNVSALPTQPDLTRQFKKGDRLQIVPASFATAGALVGNLICRDSASVSA